MCVGALQAWQDEQNEEQRVQLEVDGAFLLPEASIEDEDQDDVNAGSSDEDMYDDERENGGQGGRQQRLFRYRGAPKDSPDDYRPVTTSQHILGLAKVRQVWLYTCLLYTSPSPRDATLSRMPSSA